MTDPSALLDTVLARQKRAKEIEAEINADYAKWVRKLNSHTITFLRHIKDLDFSDPEQRTELYDRIDTYEPRFKNIRERDEIGEVPIDVTMELDALVQLLEDSSEPGVVRTAMWGHQSPAEKRRAEKRHEKQEAELAEKVDSHRDEVVDQLQAVYDALPEE